MELFMITLRDEFPRVVRAPFKKERKGSIAIWQVIQILGGIENTGSRRLDSQGSQSRRENL